MKAIKYTSLLFAVCILGYTAYAQINENIFETTGTYLTLLWVKATLVDLYLGVFFILCWIYFRERSLVKVLLLAPLAFVFGNAVIFLYIFFSIRKYDYDIKKWLTDEKQQRQ